MVNISLKKNGKNAPGGDVPQASKSFTFRIRAPRDFFGGGGRPNVIGSSIATVVSLLVLAVLPMIRKRRDEVFVE